MPECITKDALLQPPQTELTFPASGIMSTPFTLNGAPYVNKPQALNGAIKYNRKTTARTDITNLESYFADDNYYLTNISTENIIEGDIKSTLRFNSKNYSLKFIAFHKNIWGLEQDKNPQVSAVFTSPDGSFFHLCIPVAIQADDANENLFLKFWLKETSRVILPNGFTMNDLLNFRKEKEARFATLEYCLQYNGTRNLSPYVFCLFKTPLILSSSNLPQWLSADPSLSKVQESLPEGSKESMRLTTFDQIFNFVLRGEVSQYVFDRADPYLISRELHFDGQRTQNAISPTYYNVKTDKLYGKAIKEGFTDTASLNNVKCYPIDLATQIDDNGTVIIDPTTNKPVDLKSLNETNNMNINLSGVGGSNKRLKDKENQNWIMFGIAMSAVGLVFLAIAVATIVWFYQGKAIGSVPVPLGEAAIAPIVAALVAASASASASATTIANAKAG